MNSHDQIHVDHVGIAVRDQSSAEQVLIALGGSRVESHRSCDGLFEWTMYRLGDGCQLKLISPIDDTESFLTTFLDEHGPGLHYVTLTLEDIDAVVEQVESAGFSVVERQKRDGWEEAFVSPRNPTGVLVQLVRYYW